MHSDISQYHVEILMALLMIASATAMVLKFVRLPYAIALVLVGLFIGVFHLLPVVEMTPELVLVVFLPALLFEAAWNIDLKALKRDWLAIGTFASVGVILSMLVVAFILNAFGGVNMSAALLFGAMIAAIDPISVLALFKAVGMDRRLTLLLEGESLFNDGTAVVLFNLVLAIVAAGGSFSLARTAGNFIFVVLGGAAIGTLIGIAASRLTRYFDDHLLELTLTAIVAYGSYLLAEHAHVSPVIAVLAAGITVGNYGSRTSMSATTRLAVNSFWEYAAFVVNSLVFLLIGMQVKLDLLVNYGQLIGIGIVAIIAARAIMVYGLSPLVSTKFNPIPWAWRHVLVWGGVRGALCMALALSLPLDFPMRERIVILTFGVVLFTLIVQGLTMEPAVRLLGMVKKETRLNEYQFLRASLMAEEAALTALNEIHRSRRISSHVYDHLKDEIERKQSEIKRRIYDLHIEDASIEKLESNLARRHLLDVRKDFIGRLSREQVVGTDVVGELLLTIDRQLDSLRDGSGSGCGDGKADPEPETAQAPGPDCQTGA